MVRLHLHGRTWLPISNTSRDAPKHVSLPGGSPQSSPRLHPYWPRYEWAPSGWRRCACGPPYATHDAQQQAPGAATRVTACMSPCVAACSALTDCHGTGRNSARAPCGVHEQRGARAVDMGATGIGRERRFMTHIVIKGICSHGCGVWCCLPTRRTPRACRAVCW